LPPSATQQLIPEQQAFLERRNGREPYYARSALRIAVLLLIAAAERRARSIFERDDAMKAR
jgi:hypothetical protein